MPTSVFFSPDGRSIGVVQADQSLKKISLADGLATTLASGVDSQRPAWGDEQIVFTRERTLWQIAASGGAPTQLTTLDDKRGDLLHAWPLLVPQARAILFMCLTQGGSARVESLSLPTGERRVLLEQASFPLYAPSGHLIFYRDGAVLAAPFDAKRLTLTGPPGVVVVEGVGAPHVALSETGSLVYATGATRSRLVWVSRQGTEQALNDTPQAYQNPRLSPDGQRILVEVAEATGDLWIQDPARGAFTRLTSGSGASFPIWTPDGKRVVFRTPFGLRWMNADGSGRVEAIPDTSVADFPQSVSPDGRTLVILRIATDTSGDVFALSLDGAPELRPIVSTRAYEGGAQLSPDGRFLAYASNESGRMEVYVRPFPGPDRKWQVSTEGATHPLWSRSGREIFYRSGHKMMAVEFSTGPEPTLSPPRLLFERDYSYGSAVTRANYDVTADGQRFVMVKEEGSGGGRLNVVLNWFEELKQRVPARSP
jgi:serine/threonine-protein kinase